MQNTSTLVQYYAAIDESDLDRAMRLVEPDVRFAIHLPDSVRRGSDREGLTGYLTGRGPVQREHLPLRVATDGDTEFVYGAIREDGNRITGHFLASVRLSADQRIAAYQVSFDTELALVPEKEQ